MTGITQLHQTKAQQDRTSIQQTQHLINRSCLSPIHFLPLLRHLKFLFSYDYFQRLLTPHDMSSFSLETIGEILSRLETKVDKVNGSVAAIANRAENLEKKDIDQDNRLRVLETRQEEARRAHSNFIWKILAPISVTVFVAVGGILIRLAA